MVEQRTFNACLACRTVVRLLSMVIVRARLRRAVFSGGPSYLTIFRVYADTIRAQQPAVASHSGIAVATPQHILRLSRHVMTNRSRAHGTGRQNGRVVVFIARSILPRREQDRRDTRLSKRHDTKLHLGEMKPTFRDDRIERTIGARWPLIPPTWRISCDALQA